MLEKLWLKRVQKYGWYLSEAPDHIRDNFDIVLAAVTEYGFSLKYASERLRDDKDIVLAAVANNGRALYYASDRLRDDFDMVMGVVAITSLALLHASDRLQNDPELVLTAIGDIVKYDPDLDKVPLEWVLVAVRHGFVFKNPEDYYYQYWKTCQTLVLLMKKDVLCKDVVKKIKELM